MSKCKWKDIVDLIKKAKYSANSEKHTARTGTGQQIKINKQR